MRASRRQGTVSSSVSCAPAAAFLYLPRVTGPRALPLCSPFFHRLSVSVCLGPEDVFLSPPLIVCRKSCRVPGGRARVTCGPAHWLPLSRVWSGEKLFPSWAVDPTGHTPRRRGVSWQEDVTPVLPPSVCFQSWCFSVMFKLPACLKRHLLPRPCVMNSSCKMNKILPLLSEFGLWETVINPCLDWRGSDACN